MPSVPIFTGNLFVGNLFSGRLFYAEAGPIPESIPQQLRVPRIPVRLKRPDNLPLKEDPRVVRFSESLMLIVNGLLRNQAIIRVGQDEWVIPVLPRQCADADAFNGEVFLSTDDLVLKYKTPGDTVYTFNMTLG